MERLVTNAKIKQIYMLYYIDLLDAVTVTCIRFEEHQLFANSIKTINSSSSESL